jgi:hypothetical protein
MSGAGPTVEASTDTGYAIRVSCAMEPEATAVELAQILMDLDRLTDFVLPRSEPVAFPVRVVRINYGSPFVVVITAGPLTASLLVVLRMLRDWRADKRIAAARAEVVEAQARATAASVDLWVAFHERLANEIFDARALPLQGPPLAGSRFVQPFEGNLDGGRDLADVIRRLGEVIEEVDPVRE